MKKRPVSITVIAVLLLVGIAADILLVPDIRYQMNTIFGIYVFAWTAFFVFVFFFLVRLIVAIGLLRCKPWARLAAILLYAYWILDTCLTGLIPGGFSRYTQALRRSHHAISFSAGLVSGNTLRAFLEFVLPVLVGIPLWFLFIYLLWSRRAAFRRVPLDTSGQSLSILPRESGSNLDA